MRRKTARYDYAEYQCCVNGCQWFVGSKKRKEWPGLGAILNQHLREAHGLGEEEATNLNGEFGFHLDGPLFSRNSATYRNGKGEEVFILVTQEGRFADDPMYFEPTPKETKRDKRRTKGVDRGSPGPPGADEGAGGASSPGAPVDSD